MSVQIVSFKCRQSDGVSDITRMRYVKQDIQFENAAYIHFKLEISDRLAECLTPDTSYI